MEDSSDKQHQAEMVTLRSQTSDTHDASTEASTSNGETGAAKPEQVLPLIERAPESSKWTDAVVKAETRRLGRYLRLYFHSQMAFMEQFTISILDEKAESSKWTDAVVKSEARRLGRYLRLYFHPAFRLHGDKCTVHVFYCVLFLVQLVKLCLITQQMFMFGKDRNHFGSIVNRGQTTLRHLLLKDWDANWETLPYPPSNGEFAAYDVKDIIKRVNFAVERYYNVENVAIGYYTILDDDDLSITLRWFDFLDTKYNSTKTDCKLKMSEITFPAVKGLSSHKDNTTNQTVYTYDIMKDFRHQNLTSPIKKLLVMTMKFSLHSIRIFELENQALCLSIAGELTVSDIDNNGQAIVQLNTVSSKAKCSTLGIDITDWSLQRASQGLANSVIIVCCMGLVITLIVFAFAVFVFVQTKLFMRKYYQAYYQPEDQDEKDLPAREYFRFVLMWDLCATLADCLTLYGTIKIIFKTERRQIDLDELDMFTIWLATGCFFAWFNILRFVKFYKKFRLLFNTVYRAFSDVAAYIICVAVLYAGFFVVGYVVLGPYNIKFSTPSRASETLFALVNGDEMYTTLAIMETADYGAIWWFSRVFFWTYIAVFTVIVLNLLVAIFMSAYEAVKDSYDQQDEDEGFGGPVEKALREFIENPTRTSFRTSLHDLMASSSRVASSTEEVALRRQLAKLCRLSTTGDDVILVRPRSLKSIMGDDTYKAREFRCCCVTFSFILFFQNYETVEKKKGDGV